MRPTARALLSACHPGPTAVVTVVSTGLAFSVGLPLSTILLVAATILANQLSIGWSNDAIDAARKEDEEAVEGIAAEVREFATSFPMPGY